MVAPIKPSRLVHHLMRRVRFPSEWPPVGIHPDAPLEKIRPTPYQLEKMSVPRTFITKEDLYVGPGKWSQVYRARRVSMTSSDVVLKVYKTSLFPYPATHPDVIEITPPWCPPRDDSYRWTDELMSWAEVYAYSKFAPLQGTAVPKLIDAFTKLTQFLRVKSPGSDGESLAIAMSYVKGKPIIQACQELGSDEDEEPDLRWYPIGMELLRTIHAIHQHGIIFFDVRGSNIFVEEHAGLANGISTSHDPVSKYSLKIIDFAMPRPYDFPSASVLGGYRLKLLRDHDILRFELLLNEIYGDEMGREHRIGYDLAGSHRRKSEFLKWVHRNYAHEKCVQDFWPILKGYVSDTYKPLLKRGLGSFTPLGVQPAQG